MFSDLLACVCVCLFGGHTTDQKRIDSEKSFRKIQPTITLNNSFQFKITLLVGLDSSSQSIWKQIWKQIHNAAQTHLPSQMHILTPQSALSPQLACLNSSTICCVPAVLVIQCQTSHKRFCYLGKFKKMTNYTAVMSYSSVLRVWFFSLPSL